MAQAVIPSAKIRQELEARGGETIARCYQCATCTSVCELSTNEIPFPRKQMLLAQWGMGEKLAADPAVWLCYQCNDCTLRCPRDAKPGDIMNLMRSIVIEQLAVPKFMGTLVAKANVTWPLLLGLPVVIWWLFLTLTTGFEIPAKLGADAPWHHFVHLWQIYVMYFTVTGLVALTMFISGTKFWKMLGENNERKGSFFAELIPVAMDVMTHKNFASCGAAANRRWGHFALFWGFASAAIASGWLVVEIYILGNELPFPQMSFGKLLGNFGAILLVIGGVILLGNRLNNSESTGKTTSFDTFFLATVLLVIVTGILTELGRYFFPVDVASWIYVFHLGFVLCLFSTIPYSKFAHMIYRFLAMVHERMVQNARA